MGSPVSPIVANLYMEHFEERAITEAPQPPDIWLMYVDDTFTVLQESEVEHFTHHLNSMNIKFSVEPEQDNTLSFLDTDVCLNDDGSTKVKIYIYRTQTISGQDTPPKGRKPNNGRRRQEHRGGPHQESAESKRLQNLDV